MSNLKENNKQKIKQIGVIDRSRQIWLEGMYYSSIDMDADEISEKIPILGVTDQVHEGRLVKELLLIYTDNQSSIVVLNNMQLEENLTTLDGFATGSEDLLNESRFQAIRVGTFTGDGFDPNIPKFRAKLQSLVREASEEEIKCFQEHTDFTFLRWFYQTHFNDLIIILSNIFEKLSEYDNFKHDLFIRRVSEIGGKLPSEMLSSMLKQFQEIKRHNDNIIGHVTNSRANEITIISLKHFNPLETPLIKAKGPSGNQYVLLVKSLFNEMIESTILYGLNKNKEPIAGIFNIPKGTPIVPITWDDIDCTLKATTSTRVDPIYLPIGRIIGVEEMGDEKFIEIEEDKVLNKKLIKRSKGELVDIPGEFKIAITPGELSNGIFIGDSGSGKSNCISILITSIAHHNRFGIQNKIGLLLFDKEGEYYGIFQELINDKEYSDYFLILDAVKDNDAKFPIKDIPLSYFSEEQYEILLSTLLETLYDMGELKVEPPKCGRENRMTIEALNYLLEPRNVTQRMEELNLQSFNTAQIMATIRRIKKAIIIFEPILQLTRDSNGLYEKSDNSNKNAYHTLVDMQKKGKILILNMQRFTNSQTYKIYSDLVTNKLQFLRQEWFRESLEESKGSLLNFTSKAPVLLIINEEATNHFAGMAQSEIQNHIRNATGARKFNMGSIYIFQTLQGIESGISLILSQLGGFNFIFAVTQERSLKTTIKNINIRNADSLEDFIKNAKSFKYCVASSESYDQRPYFIQSYRASDYFEVIFQKKMVKSSRDDREFDLRKEEKSKQPKKLASGNIDKEDDELLKDI